SCNPGIVYQVGYSQCTQTGFNASEFRFHTLRALGVLNIFNASIGFSSEGNTLIITMFFTGGGVDVP
ncbi:hypothetical protein, partial [Enterobacter kobei]|uniref:hypothetical protein n=1 Tax=Enterobacter kobei TaxID=208224 RepID=UPI0035C5852D